MGCSTGDLCIYLYSRGLAVEGDLLVHSETTMCVIVYGVGDGPLQSGQHDSHVILLVGNILTVCPVRDEHEGQEEFHQPGKKHYYD